MSIEKRGKSWSTRLMNPLTSKRERFTLPCRGISKREFLKKALEQEAEWNRTLYGMPPVSAKNYGQLFLVVGNDWIKNRRTQWGSTKARHAALVLGFEEFIGKDALIASVTAQQCRDFMRKLEDVNKHGQETRRKEFSILKSIFEFAVDEGYITANPWRKVEPPKMPKGRTEYLTEKEFQKLLEAAGTLETLPKRKRQEAVIKGHQLRYAFLAYTGVRRGEAQSVRWGDVDFNSNQIEIQNAQKGEGTEHENRFIPIHPTLLPMLKEASKGKKKHEFVFLHRENWLREIKKDAENARINRTVTIHMLRHTFGSWLAQNGASPYEIRDLMGHQTVKTSDRYTHLVTEHLRTAINRIGKSGTKIGPKAGKHSVEGVVGNPVSALK